MSETVISVENLSKAYRLGVINHGMMYKDIQSWWARLRGKDDPNAKLDIYNKNQMNGEDRFWALRDISFEVKRGDRIGIIGKNGAGKSTLLKVLSRVTAPTSGKVKVRGRIASLLEVGTGFHPELTGRENVYLNGAILGMMKNEISKKFDEIVDFAGIETFIDTPVKRYSSGMYVRLAFAVAAHLEPEILVVDEVLAVGDAEFQKRAIGKMEDVSKGEGRTILFVSHNMAAITNLCSTGLVLEDGQYIFYGEATDAVSKYMETNLVRGEQGNIHDKFINNTGKIIFKGAHIYNEQKQAVASVKIHETCFVEMEFLVNEDVKGISVPNYHFKTGSGIYAFIINAPDMKVLEPGLYRASCKIPGNFLNEGMYIIDVAVTEYYKASIEIHVFKKDYLTLTVIDPIINNSLRYNYGGPIPGVMRPKLDWKVALVN